MKKILFLLFVIITGLFTYCDTVHHKCVDSSHDICVDKCDCYGKACPKQECKSYYYHITLEDTAMIISDHGRFVASVPYDKTGILDSIFIKDNE